MNAKKTFDFTKAEAIEIYEFITENLEVANDFSAVEAFMLDLEEAFDL